LWYPHGACFELVGYSDSDFAGCRVDRKSTSGGCHLLGRSLVAWSSKKQNGWPYPLWMRNTFPRGLVVLKSSI
jgi:hypothetical protein